MSRLHIYTVHVNPSLELPYEKAQFVEEGFSWRAFVFGLFYTLYHRLWLATIGILAATAISFSLMEGGALTHTGYTILELALHSIIGFYVNDWRRAKLRNNGFIIADIVTGDSALRAELRFFDRYFASRNKAAFVA